MCINAGGAGFPPRASRHFINQIPFGTADSNRQESNAPAKSEKGVDNENAKRQLRGRKFNPWPRAV
jgi:hypothetical protein